ncbi:MAG: hypothetical protein ACRD36_13270, partial [Candidatus Acidiferrum sp.]
MPSWGDDNFSNDGAREYLELRAAQLVATISEIVANKQRMRPNEDGEGMLMPSVELLALLCERYGAVPPHLAIIRQWSDKYLNAFDKADTIAEPTPGFRVARRKVIQKTFRWLEGLAE